jgi:hypothetical protein
MLFLGWISLPHSARAQINIEAESKALVGTSGDLPFWFHSNRYGMYDAESSNLLQRINLFKETNRQQLYDYGFGADVIGRVSADEALFFNELYGKIKVGVFELYGGKKEWKDGIWQSDLSMGSMIWSSNAATMPKIMLRIPEYTPVPFTNNHIAFRGYLGHGWFGDDRYVEDTYLHEKALYLRLLREDFPVNGHVGLIHNVQWGGTHPTIGKLPGSFDDYWRIFAGKAGDANNSPGGEVINALGNTVGAYEARLDVDLQEIDITAYRQFFIETSVSTRFRSPWDGQWGLKLGLQKMTNNFIQSLLWEHLNTKNQNAQSGETIGADQYFHNYIYRNGWSYKGRIMGSPLVSLGTVNGRTEVLNNIILAHHLALKGEIPIALGERPVKYQMKGTYSRSYGRTSNCGGDFCDENDPQPLRTPRQDQWYFELAFDQQVNNRLNVNTSIGLDTGDLSNEFGLMLGISYKILESN